MAKYISKEIVMNVLGNTHDHLILMKKQHDGETLSIDEAALLVEWIADVIRTIPEKEIDEKPEEMN